MLINITTTHHPATDLGYLLHKHPDKFQSVELSSGKAHIFYPEKGEDKTTICLLLDINPIDMVRNAKKSGSFSLGQYVNDRPYVASSMMSVAIAKAFSSAMNGHCKDKPELVNVPFPLEIHIPVVSAPRGGDALISKMFEPLGYSVECGRHPLDEQFPEWGESKYYDVKLWQHITVKEMLSHLYVLLPALDVNKHYYVNAEEIAKLLQKGEGWLNSHPEKEQITRRYLADLHSLTRQALEQLGDNEGAEEDAEPQLVPEKVERLHEMRLKAVAEQLASSDAEKVLDLGCGEGKLIRILLKEKQYAKITGMDVSYNELLKAKEKLHFDEMSPRQKERIDLFQGSLTYCDARLKEYDAAAVVEVIEHIDADRLDAFEKALFAYAQPKTIVLTTPNSEYNQIYDMETETMRHADHRFEWTRAQFTEWVEKTAHRYHYTWEIYPVGVEDPQAGAPCQMVVFKQEVSS